MYNNNLTYLEHLCCIFLVLRNVLHLSVTFLPYKLFIELFKTDRSHTDRMNKIYCDVHLLKFQLIKVNLDQIMIVGY